MLTQIDWRSRFLQQARWTASLRRYLYQRLSLPSSPCVLEVGCGTGAILADFNSQPEIPIKAENLRLFGLDINSSFLSIASIAAPSACLAQGDAHFLPYASASFDLTICHFVLLWLASPLAALAEMRRVTRPGGLLLALAEPDYGGRIDYPASLSGLAALQEQALHLQGADTRLGRRLGALFIEAGLQEAEVGVLGGQWQLPEDLNCNQSDPNTDSEWAVLEADLQSMLEPEEFASLKQLDLQARQAGQRILFVPTFWACGKRR